MPIADGAGWRALIDNSTVRKSDNCDAREILIEASRRATAQRALELILAAHSLIYSEPPPWPDDYEVQDHIASEKSTNSLGHLDSEKGRYYGATDFPLACHIAAACSWRKKHCYALALHRLSLSLHANYAQDLEPRSYPQQHRSFLPRDHVRYAYSIVTAYAVLEQIDLALNNQSHRNNAWIPESKVAFVEKLRANGIDPHERVVWMLRGGKTRLENAKGRPPKNSVRASWAFAKIRDKEIEVIDAIADLRFLRSKVAAHKISELSNLISIYDVSNAQRLVGYLLMVVLGFDESKVGDLRSRCRMPKYTRTAIRRKPLRT
ncbi:hypothetical protein B7486_00290 [cyanobacterium TDX16]|nr:hypothetical protein B7486_00290 [cyanobacterium TDX16]